MLLFSRTGHIETAPRALPAEVLRAKFNSGTEFASEKISIFVTTFFPDFSPLPCNATQVALYATWLARNLKFSSIKNYLSGLNHFIRQNGFPPIDYSDFVLESTLRGIKRELGNSP